MCSMRTLVLHREYSTDDGRGDSRDLLDHDAGQRDRTDEPSTSGVSSQPASQRPAPPSLKHLLTRNAVAMCRPLSLSRRSLQESRPSLTSDVPQSQTNRAPDVNSFLNSLSLLAMASLIVNGLAVILLTAFLDAHRTMEITPEVATNVHHNTSRDPSSGLTATARLQLCRAGVALTSLVLSACLCCFLMCSMQALFAAKIIKFHEGEERALKYLNECSSSRVLAVSSFFLSVPVFLAALVLLVVARINHVDDAMVGAVLLAFGVIGCVVGAIQTCHHWRVERSRAECRLPVYDSRFSVPSNLAHLSNQKPDFYTLV